MENNELSLRIADRIKKYRKRSERFIGFVPYSLNFEQRRYHAISQKPEKISLLEKTIVHLVGKDLSDISDIAECLGFDMADEIEKGILDSKIEDLKTWHQLIKANDSKLSLTNLGRQYILQGKYITTFSSHFDIFVVPQQISFPYLKDCTEIITDIKVGQKGTKKDNLTLDQIKHLAEHQASFAQFAENEIQLISTTLIGFTTAKISFYVCFVQSIRDNSIRTIIYDDSSDSVIKELSQLFDHNDILRDDLLKQCLKNEVLSEDAVQVESGEKTEEQIASEARILEEEDLNEENIDENSSDSYKNKVGALYDSVEFENELQLIFEKRQNDEIWLISPWIRRYAFLRKREPMIRKFLDQGGAIFIGYSEPEKVGEEMVDAESMSIIKRLDDNYDKFYFAELPKFHFKNVIEHKGDKTTLYTGSFNILSFCINGSEEHYRMEQMILANHTEAKNKRQCYLLQFAERYVMGYMEKMKSSESGMSINLTKLEYLKNVNALTDTFAKLEDIAQNGNLTIKTFVRPDEDELVKIANKIIDSPYIDDKYYIQARLAAMLFLFELGKRKQESIMQSSVETELNRIVNRKSIYQNCRFSMARSRINSKKSIVYIICNGFNFEFRELELTKHSFKTISKYKEHISFKESNIKYAKTIIEDLLYNSAKSIGIVD